MQLSSALATLSRAFQGDARARAFAFWGSVVGIGIASGPVIGGLITQNCGWEWAFYVNLPIGLALLALIIRVIEPSRDPDATRLDLPGVACLSGALFLATLALIEVNHRGWADPWTLGEMAGAFALFSLFIAVELRQARPMLDLWYFRKPTYIGANIAQLSFSAGVLTMLTFIPILLQSGLGHGSGKAGLMMLPMVVPLFIVPRIVSGHLAHRLSGRAILTIGLFLVCMGLFWLAAVVRNIAYGPLIGGMLLLGVGAGLLNGETTKVGMTVIPRERAGMASGISGTVRFSGLVIGLAALGAVLYGRIARTVADALPYTPALHRQALVRDIAAGNLVGATLAGRDPLDVKSLAMASFAGGYQAVFLAGALFMLVSTILTWCLVSAAETRPISVPAPRRPVVRGHSRQ
jgi:MFS family permease